MGNSIRKLRKGTNEKSSKKRAVLINGKPAYVNGTLDEILNRCYEIVDLLDKLALNSYRRRIRQTEFMDIYKGLSVEVEKYLVDLKLFARVAIKKGDNVKYQEIINVMGLLSAKLNSLTNDYTQTCEVGSIIDFKKKIRETLDSWNYLDKTFDEICANITTSNMKESDTFNKLQALLNSSDDEIKALLEASPKFETVMETHNANIQEYFKQCGKTKEDFINGARNAIERSDNGVDTLELQTHLQALLELEKGDQELNSLINQLEDALARNEQLRSLAQKRVINTKNNSAIIVQLDPINKLTINDNSRKRSKRFIKCEKGMAANLLEAKLKIAYELRKISMLTQLLIINLLSICYRPDLEPNIALIVNCIMNLGLNYKISRDVSRSLTEMSDINEKEKRFLLQKNS